MKQATLGFRVHSGWAVAVALCGPSDSPLRVDRRRFQLVKNFTYNYRQPYHTGEKMPRKDAAKFIAGVRAEAARLAQSSLHSMQTDLAEQDCRIGRCALLLASGRALPGLEQILASHALIHTADGELFREALRVACTRCRLPLEAVREKELFEIASKRLGVSAIALKRRIAAFGKSSGPPWTVDDKFAALAAWLALGR
jgi:hypothetical protein